ncbi:Imm26 family immunity protein [Shewanella salipaludis]|uniref:Immunity protein 26 of polymorphic toxin system n=1 Tax=Shewanella salipaludis TaxID=2723052 RepID=A0A972FX99_9GAMM|nr:Imm26 family immunity protein [Shewanella salipaludis]NMH66934.1 hypothetical protein [Shewanella salipaludis]
MTKKKIDINIGDVFVIPLENGDCYSVGVVVEITPEALNSVLCGFYDVKLNSTNEYSYETIGNLISIQFVTPDLLKNGQWMIVGHSTPLNPNDFFDFDGIKKKRYIGVEIEGSAIIRKFLSAYHGLHHWNCYYKDDYFDGLLLNPRNKPSNIYLIEK